MALIVDPDNLSQGSLLAVADAAWGTPSGRSVDITSATDALPVLQVGEFFSVRNHTNSENNGLYQVTALNSPETGSITALKITGTAPVSAAAEAVDMYGNSSGSPQSSTQKSIHIDISDRQVYILEQGLVSADGVTLQALYSFLKEEWKADNDLIPYPFPMVAITPEQFEFSDNWNPEDDTASPIKFRTRKLIRTGGWSELDLNGILKKQYVGVITLGSFEDSNNDTAYYQFGTDTTVDDTVDFDFAGPVNEAIKTYEELDTDYGSPVLTFAASTITRGDGGSFITDGYKVGGQVAVRASALSPINDGTYVITAVTASVITVTGTPFTAGNDTGARVAVDNRNALTVRLRVRDGDTNGKTYDQADLPDIGVTEVDNKAFRFPLANATDLKISATDATIDGSLPYTGMSITYHATAQTRSGFVADGALSPLTDGQFGIIVDGNNGTAEQIYEFVQRQLRKTTDIDNDGDTAIGRTMDELLEFVGDNLKTGTFFPNNPDGGGSGVYIDNYDTNDTNRLTFTDNAGLERVFPFVAAGSINFNNNLVNDTGPATYWMFYTYTERFTNGGFSITGASGANATLNSATTDLVAELASGDYIAISGMNNPENNGIWQLTGAPAGTGPWTAAVVKIDDQTVVNEAVTSPETQVSVDKNPINSPDAIIVNSSTSSPLPITGDIVGSSVSFDFDYDNNTQGGRTAGTDAEVTLRAIGLDTAQFVETTGTITRTVGLSFSLVAALERNYSNP